MKRLLQLMKRYWWLYLLGLTAMAGGIYLDMHNPIITGRIIDEVIEAGDKTGFKTLILMLVGITVGRAVFGYFKELCFDYAGVSITTNLRQRIFDHIQGLSYNFFDSKNTGELMARIKEDAEKISHSTSFGIMLVVEASVSLVIASVLMFRISPILSLMAFITMPVIAAIALSLEKNIGKTFENISEQNAMLNTTAQENIAGVRLVKAFAREKYEIQKFLERNEGYYKLNFEQSRVWSMFYPRIEFISGILPIMVIAFGGALVIGEDLSIGTLIMFSEYMNMVIWPMRNIGWLSNVMAEALASIKKIDSVLVCHSEIVNKENGIKVEEMEGKVEFSHVSLEVQGTKILDDISFTIEPNKTLAIMGSTGSGKSSIINVMTRFFDHTEGSIKIDGNEIKEYDLYNLRSHISVVMQEVFLFSDTIEENILFGVKETTNHEKMLQSSMSAQAHEFIDRMDDNYQTVIGEKGIGLSGGQKQRISIARALAKKANILIFDDSTSALDMETEYKIQHEIEKLENMTKIIIAHRISAVKKADEIIILENGRIIERGSHDELIRLKGKYYQTYQEQYEGYMAG